MVSAVARTTEYTEYKILVGMHMLTQEVLHLLWYLKYQALVTIDDSMPEAECQFLCSRYAL